MEYVNTTGNPLSFQLGAKKYTVKPHGKIVVDDKYDYAIERMRQGISPLPLDPVPEEAAAAAPPVEDAPPPRPARPASSGRGGGGGAPPSSAAPATPVG